MTESTEQKRPSRLRQLYEGKMDLQSLFFQDWLLTGLAIFIPWAVIAAPLVHANAGWFNTGRTLYMKLTSPEAVAFMVLLPAFWFVHTLLLTSPLWKTLSREQPPNKVPLLMIPVVLILGMLGFSLYWASLWYEPLYLVPVLAIPNLLALLVLFLRRAPR